MKSGSKNINIIEKTSVMTKNQKTIYSALLIIGLILTVGFGVWWFQPSHIPDNFKGIFHVLDFSLFCLLSYIVWYQIINELFAWDVALNMRHPKHIEPKSGLKVAFLTAFVPGSEPYDILEKTLKAMSECNYPHDTWLLDEGNDEFAKSLCEKYGVKHYTRNGIPEYNLSVGPYRAKTKGGNYNSWYNKYGNKYEFVAQIDVDFTPRTDFLVKTLGYFNDPNVAFVGSPQIYGNIKDSWIAEGAAQQAYNFYGSMQKGLYGNDMQLFIGANHVVRVEAHNSIDGYAGHIVEDHITGMKFYTKKWKSVYVPEILAVGEGPATWDAYFSQQMRWAYGLIHILFTESPSLFPKMKIKHAVNYFLLQQYYFAGFAQLLSIFLLSLFFILGIKSTTMPLLPILILYVPLLIWQQIVFLWLQRFNIRPKIEKGLMLKSKLLNYAVWPVYFLAFTGVIIGKRLTYKVTPKGSQQKAAIPLAFFIPHFILGSITAVDIAASIYLHHYAPQLLFWAILNTVIMGYFSLLAMTEKIKTIAGSLTSLNLFPRFKKQFSIPRIVLP